MNQQSAQGLAALGRGPDSMLVHMAPGEVKSLQQLAMAHGGSLTINPETGLPEAGFLSSLLPMIIGGGLSIASGGTLTPLMAAMMTGGGYAAATGSLKKGLMAGLGAYGGAGLGGALAGAGATQGLIAGDAASKAAMGSAANAKDLLLARGAETAAPGMFGNAAANFSNAGAGISGLGSEAGRNAFMSQIGGGKGLMQAGAMAASPMMMETTTKQPEIKQDTSMGQRYQFNAGAQTPTPIPDVPGYGNQGLNFGRERQYFNPSYTAIDDDAAKKQYGFASGGPIQDMSNANNMAAYMGMDKFADGGEIDEYTYDPVTQMYTKKAGEGATVVSPINATYGASGSSGSSEYVDSNPGWSGKTPAERAAYYAENPTMAAITQALQKGFGYTTLGMAQNYFTPDIPAHAGMEARGIDPGAYSERNAMAELGSRDALPGTTSVNLGLPDYPTYTGDQPGDYDGQSGGNQSGNSETGGLGSGDGGMGSGGGRSAGDARGGFYTNGKFDQRPANMAQGGLSALAQGGISNLGDYSDGGRLLRGPGDGISDSIPAMIGKKQPARLADGEFVVPARIVSELGNGSTEAGARKLYAMMDRVQKARKKTVGKGKVAANSRAAKYLPA